VRGRSVGPAKLRYNPSMRSSIPLLLALLACTPNPADDTGPPGGDSPGDSPGDSRSDSATDTADSDPPDPITEGQRVLLIYDPAVEGSLEVAQAYAAFREVPDEQLCGVEASTMGTITGEEFATWAPRVQACIDEVEHDLYYLVPVYGVPLRVSGQIEDIAGDGTMATVSLDALLFLGGLSATLSNAIYNPAWREGDSMAGSYDPYLPWEDLLPTIEAEIGVPAWMVVRLDGVDSAASLDLIDRAQEAQALADAGDLAGVVYVDGRYGDSEPTSDEFGSYESGEWNMWGTRTIFEGLGSYEVVWDGNGEEFGTEPAPTACPDALYYAGWYSYNHYNDAFTWAPGAIGGHLDSCSACDIRGSTSWSALALQRGITATFGAVSEPYVAGMPEYDQFFLYLLQGATFGEAAYESTRVGLWMMQWIGDPLYRPYPEPLLGR
jgi:uncharacterized protein (TIGR03790 family)